MVDVGFTLPVFSQVARSEQGCPASAPAPSFGTSEKKENLFVCAEIRSASRLKPI